jgi:hypothetical protein
LVGEGAWHWAAGAYGDRSFAEVVGRDIAALVEGSFKRPAFIEGSAVQGCRVSISPAAVVAAVALHRGNVREVDPTLELLWRPFRWPHFIEGA